jgi:hypothetical protein
LSRGGTLYERAQVVTLGTRGDSRVTRDVMRLFTPSMILFSEIFAAERGMVLSDGNCDATG